MKRLIILIMAALLMGTVSLKAGQPASAETTISQDPSELKLQRNTGSFVYISGGPGLILTEVDMGNVTSGEPNFSGEVNVGFEWISKKKIGVGLMYNGYFTGVESTELSGINIVRMHERWGLHYLAPQFVGRILLKSKKWSLRYALGIGMVVSREFVESEGKRVGINYDYGFGTNLSFGAEFLVTPRVGITGGVKVFDASVDQRYYSESNSAGIVRVDLDFGISFHF